MADLITLSELKERLNIPAGDTQDDGAYTQAIGSASEAITNYVARDFTAPIETETRTYEYDGSGILDVDDASAVTALSWSQYGQSVPLLAEQWRAQPYSGPVYTWIELPPRALTGSPEMGFRYNLDRIAAERGLPHYPLVNVTGTFGWTRIPEDVQQAVLWTIVAFKDSRSPYVSEAIEGYSRSTAGAQPEAIPQRAKELLEPYRRITV
jgi:hypothetical protein